MSRENNARNLLRRIRELRTLIPRNPDAEKFFRDLARLKDIAPPFPERAVAAERELWHDRCKPLYALGFLEEDLARFRVLTRGFTKPCRNGTAFVFAADNEIIAEGVSQTGAEVTATVVENMAENKATIALLATRRDCKLLPVNLGCEFLEPTSSERKNEILRALSQDCADVNLNAVDQGAEHPVLDWVVRGKGARNFLREDALTPAEVLDAFTAGLIAAYIAKDDPFIVGGEMGIGNTSSSTTVAAVLLGAPVRDLVGRGAGLSDAGLARKKQVLEEALRRRAPARNPVAVLAAVGGLDIAALTGLYLGARLLLKPVFLDGLITLVAAALAQWLLPGATEVMFATHKPRERAGGRLLDELRLTAPLDLDLALGEGAGAFFYLPLLESANMLFETLPTFSEGRVAAYEDFSKEVSDDTR